MNGEVFALSTSFVFCFVGFCVGWICSGLYDMLLALQKKGGAFTDPPPQGCFSDER